MSRPKRICICTVQSPFIRGGAEILAAALTHQLRRFGFETELIQFPFVSYPKRNLLQSALNYRLLDLAAPVLPKIDLCIPLKFPAYAIRHPLKIPWLLHQFRDVYDVFDSDYYHFTSSREDVELREAIVEIDNITLRECRHIYTISGNVSRRLMRYNGILSRPLYPPPTDPERYRPGPFGDYILSVGRLEAIKRVDLLVRAMQFAPGGLRCLIVGEGSQRDLLARLIEDLELTDRVTLLGRVEDKDLVTLFSECRAVYYAPFDEDYGYVTIEAFLSGKPVLTCSDSGGPLEFVEDRCNGWIVEPDAKEVGNVLQTLQAPKNKLEEMGREGLKSVREITWERVADCFRQFLA